MDHIISKDENGKTVKDILQKRLGLSRAFIKHLKFLEDGILLNGEHATVRRVAYEGDILSLATEDREQGCRLTPTPIDIRIAYEDSDLVVPDKPANMPTHPSHNHMGDTVADALAYRYKDEPDPFVFRPVNRLDRNTSGLVLIARNRLSAAKLSDSMRRGEIKKRYLAILDGVPEAPRGDIETHMRRTDGSIIVRKVCSADEGGDYALTRYRVLLCNNGYSLVEASPETGRTHQLRVHFAHIGCAIVGDDMYGKEDDRICRHALHACALSFPHPSGKGMTTLFSPMPEDMTSLAVSIFGKDETDRLYTSLTFHN